MQHARQILPPDWMTDYKTAKVMRVLGGYELPAEAMFVGGCVRNTLLEKPVTDIDIATIHHPLQVIERLASEGIRYVPTGLEHGTVTAIIEDAVFEITTLRKDVDTDGRHAVIAFTEKWSEDAQRRDFTINTLLASPDGSIFDPTGEGLSDLDKKRVVFVGDPAQRIAEDYLRILRFFRFYALYDGGKPDAAALAACKSHAADLAKLSRERVTQELFKIIQVPAAADILDMMFEQDVLVDMSPRYKASVMERLCEMQVRHDAVDATARLLLVADMEADWFDPWLVLSNAQKKQLQDIKGGFDLLKTISRKKIRESVYRYGNAVTLQSYLLKLAERSNLPDQEILDVARYWQSPAFPVTGADLIKAGYIPGPALGAKLDELEKKWIAKDFAADMAFKITPQK